MAFDPDLYDGTYPSWWPGDQAIGNETQNPLLPRLGFVKL